MMKKSFFYLKILYFSYIVFNVPVHLYATLSTVNLWFTKSLVLSQIYVYLLYPMSAVTFCASIYMTLAVTIERYIAVCRCVELVIQFS